MSRMLASRDVLLALIYIGIGLVYGISAFETLSIGSAVSMGPGYFPLVLSGVLVLIGLIVGLRAIAASDEVDLSVIPWRAIAMISLSSVAFAALVTGAGLLIASMVTVITASYATRSATLLSSITTAVVLTAFCVIVFVYGMQLPLNTFGTWFD